MDSLFQLVSEDLTTKILTSSDKIENTVEMAMLNADLGNMYNKLRLEPSYWRNKIRDEYFLYISSEVLNDTFRLQICHSIISSKDESEIDVLPEVLFYLKF